MRHHQGRVGFEGGKAALGFLQFRLSQEGVDATKVALYGQHFLAAVVGLAAAVFVLQAALTAGSECGDGQVVGRDVGYQVGQFVAVAPAAE